MAQIPPIIPTHCEPHAASAYLKLCNLRHLRLLRPHPCSSVVNPPF